MTVVSGLTVVVDDDAERTLGATRAFLASDPVRHNLFLTLLGERVEQREPGRYCWVRDGDAIVGFSFQSPLTFHAAISPMSVPAVEAVVARLVEVAPDLPGVMGDADTASRFAGGWVAARNVGATPTEGQRCTSLVRCDRPRPFRESYAPPRWPTRSSCWNGFKALTSTPAAVFRPPTPFDVASARG
jgi:hypothetical protein